MNLKRGSQRIAWVVLAVSVPVVWFAAYQLSEQVAGYVPRLVSSDEAKELQSSTVAIIEGLGVIYFPSYLSDVDRNARVRAVIEQAKATQMPNANDRQSIGDFAHAIRAKYPEYSELTDTDLVQRVIVKYPVYRSAVNFREFEVDEVRRKRPLWALAATIGTLATLAALLFGAIAVVSWVGDGFREPRTPAAW